MFVEGVGAPYHHPDGGFSDSHVGIEDGRVTLYTRLDLDDLWNFYYLLEPVIKPNEQIATAMNAANYAEERGAILNPSLDYFYDKSRETEESGNLSLATPDQLLKSALRDAFIEYAIDNIDEAEFVARTSVLAKHTLSGDIIDPGKKFVPYALLEHDFSKESDPTSTKKDIFDKRIRDLIRTITGPSIEGEKTILDSLKRVKALVQNDFKQCAKDNERDKMEAMYEKLSQHRLGRRLSFSFADWDISEAEETLEKAQQYQDEDGEQAGSLANVKLHGSRPVVSPLRV